MADLVSRLKTELTRSPKKTAILGIGLVVAAVFWGRMLWKPSDENEAAPETSPTSAQFAPVVTSLPNSPARSPSVSAGQRTTDAGEPTWNELLVWMRSSFEEESLDSSRDVVRDPFNADNPTLALLSLTDEPEAEAEPAEENPESVDETAPMPDPAREAAQVMTVHGILKIGNERFVRLAGQTLAMGETFEVPGVADAEGRPASWVVQKIESDGVIIRGSTGGEPLRLNLQRNDLSGVRIDLPRGD